jgi:hypothetical protein
MGFIGSFSICLAETAQDLDLPGAVRTEVVFLSCMFFSELANFVAQENFAAS